MRIALGAPRRRLSAVALGLALAGLASGAIAEPPRRLLQADFDGGSGCGSRLRGTQPGVGGEGRALLLPVGSECVFPAAGHLLPRAGTLSFWVQPVDWSGGGGRPHVFFAWDGLAEGQPFQLAVDSSTRPGEVRLLLAFGRSGDPHRQLLQIFAPISWPAGVWQKIDVTWDAAGIVLYANGKRGQRLALETVHLPDPVGARLRLTPRAAGPGDATAIDAVEIWDASFPADRVAKRFAAAREPPLAAAWLRVPRVPRAPRIDGTLDDAAWRRATRVPVLADAETGFVSLAVPTLSLAWQGDALLFAWEAPLTAPEDAVEIVLADAAGDTRRRVRVTAAGVSEASGGEAPRVAVARDGGVFRAELALPLGALRPPAARDASLRLDVRELPAAPGTFGVGAALVGAHLVLADEEEGVRIDAGDELANGRIALTFERQTPASAEVEVAGDGGRGLHRQLAVAGRSELREPAVVRGVLRVEVRDAQEWVRLEARVGPLDPPGFVALPEVATKRLALELGLGWLDGGWLDALAAGRLEARVVDRGPAGLHAEDVHLADDASARVSLAKGLVAGRHDLALTLRAGARRVTLERSIEVPALPWLDEDLGGNAGVLDPWTPLAWDGEDGVRVWDRRYGFDGPLLASVSNRNGPLLRGPMRLVLRTSTGEVPLRITGSETVSRGPARADVAGTGVFDGAGVDVRWSTWIEYDGLVVSSFTLTPRTTGTRVEGLALEVPLAERVVRYLRGLSQGSTIRRGRTPWDGRRFASAFEPIVWLTNEDEGFLAFAESAANWVDAGRTGALVVRGGADAGLTLRLIGAPVALPGPITYTLGFQATPVKPELPDARAWNFGVAGSATPHEKAIAYYTGYAVADGLFELARPEAVAKRDRELRRSRVPPLYYGATSATPDFQPVFQLFDRVWSSAWSYTYGGRAAPDNGLRPAVPAFLTAAVCPAAESFQDRMLHDAKALLATGALGVYTDTDEVFADDNPRHRCGYEDAFGRRGVTWSILGKRRFAKRLAALLREAGGGRRYWMSHAHTRLVPPVHGFADFWYPGEELAGALGRNPWLYSDGLDDEAWRVEYRGASSGIVHVFMPEFRRGSGDPRHLETRQPTESLLAMAAVNDVNVSAAYANPDAVGEYWGLREKLGLIDAEFVGHWREDCPVRAVQPDARASLYRTGRGPVLVVATRSPVATRVDVEVDLAALGLAGAVEAGDARRGNVLALEGGHLVVPLDARSYTYVTLQRRADAREAPTSR